MKIKIIFTFVVFLVLGVLTYINWTPVTVPGKKEVLKIKDLAIKNIDMSNIKKLKKLKAFKETGENSNISISVKPTEDFYKAAEENQYKIKETLQSLDLKKPPIEGNVTIEF